LEQSFGAWEGRRYVEIPELSPWGIEDYATKAPPGGESFAAVCARVAHALDRRNASEIDAPILVCTHAGVVRAALAHALDLPPAKALAFAVDCGSLTRITCIGPRDRRIEQVNVRP
ncbi:MAG TPA: histidine phosphatase family protein, partial [Kaistia sp.]|nr:histidine phosphatase family protein [Kaistia sp.]